MYRLTDQERSALSTVGRSARFANGDVLFSQGDTSDHVLVIKRGRVKVSSDAEGGHQALLGVRGPGDLVGEFAAIDARPRSATVSAIEEIDAVVVTGDRFRFFLRTHPDAAWALLSAVIGRLRESDRRRVEYGAYDVLGRLCRLLLELAAEHGVHACPGAGTTIALPLSQQELAGAAGASREAVSKALRRLRGEGAITTKRRGITILRPEVLHDHGAETFRIRANVHVDTDAGHTAGTDSRPGSTPG